MAIPTEGLFSGIDPAALTQIHTCFHMTDRSYQPGDLICSFGEGSQKIGVLLSGSASIMRVQANGSQTLIEFLSPGDVFGEVFFTGAVAPGCYSVYCTGTAHIQFFDFRHVFTPCAKACAGHSRLIENILLLISQKAAQLGQRVDILSQRTIREKLRSCFYIMSVQNSSDTFSLPFTLSALAEYLSVDRSAMTRELKKLREEGVLEIHRHTVHILSRDWLRL